ncbi:mitotic fidelity of chromosome transmission- protein [Taxawa tesnikishii (nom. ined.)]|nr:mitotic fidelity of chromosome transmission- protein [Dothideales sp. JES 119]
MPAAGLLPDGTSHDASRSIFITTKPAPTADPSPGDKEKQDTHTESTSFGSTAPQRVFRLTTGFTPINRISSSDPSHVRGEAPVNHATATDVHDPSKNASVPVPVEARKYKGRPRNLPPPSSFVPASSAPDVGSATRPLSPQPRKSYQTAAVNTLSPFLYRRTSAPMKRKKDSPSGKLVKPESKRKRKTLDPSAPQAPLVTPSALTLLQVPTTVATPAPAIDMSFNDGSLEMNFELINKYTNSIIPASAHGENRRKSVASEIRRVMRLSGASFMGTPGDSGSPEGSPMRSPANSGPVADTLVVTSKGHGPMHGGADETYATARKDTNVLGNFPELSTQAAMQEAQRALWDDFVSPEKAFDPPVKAAHKTPARISEPPGDAVTPFAAFNAQLLIQPTTASPAPMVSTQALFDAYTPIVSTTKKQQPKKRASFAPSPLAAHRSNSDTGAMQPDYEPGAVGRKTGLTLKDTGIRDEHGLEPISGIFSSFSPKGAFAKADEHAAIVEKTAVEKIPLSSGSTRPASPQRNDVSHVPIGTPVADVSDNDQEAVSSQLQQEMEQSFSHSTHKTSDQGVQRQPPAMMSSTNPASTPESYILRQEPAWSFSALDGTAEDPTADKPTIPVTAAGQSSPHRNSTLRVGVLPHQDRATPNPLNPPSSANGAPDHPTLLSWPASTHPATSTTPRSLRRRDSETPVPPSSSGFSHLELSNYQAAQRYDSSAAYPNLTGQNIHVTDAMDVMDVMDAVLDGTVEELRRDVLGSQTWDVGREIGSAVSSSF